MKRKKFEYLRISMSSSFYMDGLNKYGEEGWELVAFLERKNKFQNYDEVVFKREKE